MHIQNVRREKEWFGAQRDAQDNLRRLRQRNRGALQTRRKQASILQRLLPEEKAAQKDRLLRRPGFSRYDPSLKTVSITKLAEYNELLKQFMYTESIALCCTADFRQGIRFANSCPKRAMPSFGPQMPQACPSKGQMPLFIPNTASFVSARRACPYGAHTAPFRARYLILLLHFASFSRRSGPCFSTSIYIPPAN